MPSPVLPDPNGDPGLIVTSLRKRFWSIVDESPEVKAAIPWLFRFDADGETPPDVVSNQCPSTRQMPALAAYPAPDELGWELNQQQQLVYPLQCSIFTPLNRLGDAEKLWGMVARAMFAARCTRSASTNRARWRGEDGEPRAQDMRVSGASFGTQSPNPDEKYPTLCTRLDFRVTFTAPWAPTLAGFD